MPSVAVLGGGVSGLAAAFYMSRTAIFEKIIILEASQNLGGWVASVRNDDGSVFERGPRSIRGVGSSAYNTLELADQLGLESHILPITKAHPATRNRFVFVNNKLHVLPNSIKTALSPCPPFGRPLATYALQELFQQRASTSDESVDSFFRRRFGNDMAIYAADPLCRGVFAGNSKQLSMKSCFPLIYELEQEFGSVLWGSLRKRRAPSVAKGSLVDRVRSEKWSMWSLAGGLGEIPESLGRYLSRQEGVEIRLNSQCRKMEFTSGGKAKIHYASDGSQEVLEVDHVVCALPSYAVSKLLEDGQYSSLAAHLHSIRFAQVAVVSVQYKTNVLKIQTTDILLMRRVSYRSCKRLVNYNSRLYVLSPQGFGHLIPSHELPGVLGVIYDSNSFPQHDGHTNGTRLTVMMGGAWFEETFGDVNQCDVEKMNHLAISEIKKQLGITHQPIRVISNLLKDCIPQYAVGHSDTVAKIMSLIKTDSLPLTLVGSSYNGVSVNDCIFNARIDVEKLMQRISHIQHQAISSHS